MNRGDGAIANLAYANSADKTATAQVDTLSAGGVLTEHSFDVAPDAAGAIRVTADGTDPVGGSRGWCVRPGGYARFTTQGVVKVTRDAGVNVVYTYMTAVLA